MTTINAWHTDSRGKHIEMRLGSIKNYGLDCVDWLNSGDTVAAGVQWEMAVGVSVVSSYISGTVVAAILSADQLGVFEGKVAIPTASGLKEIVPFRVSVI